MNKPLTPHMLEAIRLARVNDGYVFAGQNFRTERGARGRKVMVASSVLYGLVRRGLATLHNGPQGEMMAKLKPEGMLLAAATKEGDPMSIAGLVTSRRPGKAAALEKIRGFKARDLGPLDGTRVVGVSPRKST